MVRNLRAYVTVCFGHDALLPYFLRYYHRLGVTEFALLTYGEARLAETEETAREYCERHGLAFTRGPSYAAQEFHHGHRQRRVRELHRSLDNSDNSGWAVHADLDEFCELPPGCASLQEVIAQSVARDCPMVCGTWLDRVSATGQLARFQEGVPLEEQFPAAAKVRQRLGMNYDCVVAAAYAPLSHHPKRTKHWGKAVKLRVHHFKWTELFREKMRQRERSQFVRGAHRKRVSRMLREIGRGVPERWLFKLPNGGRVLGI